MWAKTVTAVTDLLAEDQKKVMAMTSTLMLKTGIIPTQEICQMGIESMYPK